jgi:hypothetical protein
MLDKTQLSDAQLSALAKQSESTEQCNVPAVSGLLPTIKDVYNAHLKYREKKLLSGYDTSLNGVQSHFSDGINWALNYITKKSKSNKR